MTDFPRRIFSPHFQLQDTLNIEESFLFLLLFGVFLFLFDAAWINFLAILINEGKYASRFFGKSLHGLSALPAITGKHTTDV